jgi:ABC-type uncharacterized transport system YnjBCD permease subunit
MDWVAHLRQRCAVDSVVPPQEARVLTVTAWWGTISVVQAAAAAAATLLLLLVVAAAMVVWVARASLFSGHS